MTKRAITDGYEALNRHDLAAFMAGWRDDAKFIYPGDIPASGTFAGKSAVKGWFRRFFEQFPEIHFDVQDICVRDIFDLVGNNVVTVHWTVELTNREGQAGRNSGVTVVRIQGGKALVAKDFLFDVGEDFRRNWGAA
jgi:ketosteroid isomerase-like protein